VGFFYASAVLQISGRSQYAMEGDTRVVLAMTLHRHEPIAFIPTANAEASREFYEKTLGLNFAYDDTFAMVFSLGESRTMLRVIRVEAFTPQPFAIFGWESKDVAADVKALAANGIEFLRFHFFEQDELGIWTAPNGNQVAWFKDPDGNTLSISNHD
jgi:catechol 2,3-dioxygenase-like lactoylglutathione lyase family enzyme